MSLKLQASSWWTWRDLNPRPPACKADALPAELHAHRRMDNCGAGLGPGSRKEADTGACGKADGLDSTLVSLADRRAARGAGSAFWQPRACRRMMMSSVLARNIESVRRELQ